MNSSRTIGTIGILLLAFPIGYAEWSASQDPIAIVEEFCQEDFNGARLYQGSRSKLDSLISWVGESGWDMSVIVGGYKISDINSFGDSVKVRVEYDVLGIIGGWNWITQDSTWVYSSLWDGYAVTNFTLFRSANGWHITKPTIPPHVSPEAKLLSLEAYKLSGFIPEDEKAVVDHVIQIMRTIVSERDRHTIPPRSSVSKPSNLD